MNRQVHFHSAGYDSWHAIGDHLSPKEIWDGVLELPGTRSLTVWAARDDQYSGRIQVQVEPSNAVMPGIFVAHNDHYDLSIASSQPKSRAEASEMIAQGADSQSTAGKVPFALQLLGKEWADSMRRAQAVIERVAELG
jgi:hypothetical protein